MIRKIRYWLLRKLIGNMPFIANVEICDWDFYNALKKADELDIPHFMYNNKADEKA